MSWVASSTNPRCAIAASPRMARRCFRCLRSPICTSPAADFVRMKAIGAKTAKLRRHRTDAPASSRAIQRFPLSSGAEVANVRVADPERRRRRIFIDHLRNGPGTTAVGIIRLAHDRACRLQIQSSGGRWRIASSQTLLRCRILCGNRAGRVDQRESHGQRREAQ